MKLKIWKIVLILLASVWVSITVAFCYVYYHYEIALGMPSQYKETIIEDFFENFVQRPRMRMVERNKTIANKLFPRGMNIHDALKMLNKADFEFISVTQTTDGDISLVFLKKVSPLYAIVYKHQYTIYLRIHDNTVAETIVDIDWNSRF